METPISKKKYYEPQPGIPRWNVPLVARAKHLYALGYKNSQIQEIIDLEFQDVNLNPITITSIEQMIRADQEEFDNSRDSLTEKCYDTVRQHTAHLYNIFSARENDIVNVYAEKISQATQELRGLDIDEKDPDTGNYKNTHRIFILIELIEKLHSKGSKIIGTEALREIELFKLKAEARAASDPKGNDGLLPQARGREVEAGKAANTNWL